MKKIFATTLACALMIFGFAVSAQSQQTVSLNGNVFSSNVSKSLSLIIATKPDVKLSENLSNVKEKDGATLGYVRNNGEFVSLSDAVASAQEKSFENANLTTISLGKFNQNDTIQFGFSDSEGFHPYSPKKIEGDPGYYGGYSAESFYQLDFSEDPFDGMVEILVVGEPLPAPAVTLIVALAAGALFLLYKNRRQRSIHTEQA